MDLRITGFHVRSRIGRNQDRGDAQCCSAIQIADAVFRSQILCRHDGGHSIILQCAAAFGRGADERLLVVKPNATYRNESVIHIFDQSFTCVWEMEHVPGRRWRAVVSPRFPDSVFLCKKDLDTGEYE